MTENEKKLESIREKLETTKGSGTLHFILNAMAAVPVPGLGVFAAFSGLNSELGQNKLNEKFYSVLKDHEEAINYLWDVIFSDQKTPQKCLLLFDEVLGVCIPETYDSLIIPERRSRQSGEVRATSPA